MHTIIIIGARRFYDLLSCRESLNKFHILYLSTVDFFSSVKITDSITEYGSAFLQWRIGDKLVKESQIAGILFDEDKHMYNLVQDKVWISENYAYLAFALTQVGNCITVGFNPANGCRGPHALEQWNMVKSLGMATPQYWLGRAQEVSPFHSSSGRKLLNLCQLPVLDAVHSWYQSPTGEEISLIAERPEGKACVLIFVEELRVAYDLDNQVAIDADTDLLQGAWKAVSSLAKLYRMRCGEALIFYQGFKIVFAGVRQTLSLDLVDAKTLAAVTDGILNSLIKPYDDFFK